MPVLQNSLQGKHISVLHLELIVVFESKRKYGVIGQKEKRYRWLQEEKNTHWSHSKRVVVGNYHNSGQVFSTQPCQPPLERRKQMSLSNPPCVPGQRQRDFYKPTGLQVLSIPRNSDSDPTYPITANG